MNTLVWIFALCLVLRAFSSGIIKKIPFNRVLLRGMYTLSGEATLSKLIIFHSEKGPTLKGTNLLPVGARSFHCRVDPFQNGFGLQKSKH